MMRRASLRDPRFLLLIALVSLVLGSVPSRAGDAAEFGGFYEVTNVSSQNNGVHLTFSVRVFNRGANDVSAGTVNLCDSASGEVVHGSFANVTLAHESHIKLSATFTIPQREYDYWQQPEAGGAPNLWIEFTDSSGNPIKQKIELNAAPVGEDN